MTTAGAGQSVVDPHVLAACLDVLGQRPAGLATDIDGTLSGIAPTPAEAVVHPAARAALARLAVRLDFVGVVTGRSAADGEEMVSLPGLVYVGNHGLERRQNGVTWDHPEALAGARALSDALREIGEAARERGIDEGVVVENKRLSGSIHFRLAPDPAAAREVLLDLANAAAARYGFVVTEGRAIVELRPRVQVNKGTAVTLLAEEHKLRGIVFLGDDLTDVDAFRAVRAMREAGQVAGLRVGVLAPETPPEVLAESDVTVDGVAACSALLGAIADALAPSS